MRDVFELALRTQLRVTTWIRAKSLSSRSVGRTRRSRALLRAAPVAARREWPEGSAVCDAGSVPSARPRSTPTKRTPAPTASRATGRAASPSGWQSGIWRSSPAPVRLSAGSSFSSGFERGSNVMACRSAGAVVSCAAVSVRSVAGGQRVPYQPACGRRGRAAAQVASRAGCGAR